MRAIQEKTEVLTEEISALRSRQNAIDLADAAQRSAVLSSANEADLYSAREMQLAAVRHMPFVPTDIRVTPDSIAVEGWAGAPDALTKNLAFFLNGRRMNELVYLIEDAALKAKFAQIRGIGTIFLARMTEPLDEFRAARFLRFDASPTGSYDESAWHQAFHLMNPAAERFPVPAEANMRRVIGDTSATRFLMGGATIYKNVERTLCELGHTWADFPRILDWGCGAGRLTRYLASETGSSVTGADVDPDNIAWCRSAYPEPSFESFPLRPPVPLADDSFDLVTGISVLTHLKEDDQHRWLAELRRITRPGAVLLLSVRGPTQFGYSGFPPALYRALQAQGYIDIGRDGALDAVIGDKEYYRSAEYSRPYITRVWGEYFEVIAIVDAIAGLQDFVVMRNVKA